MPSKASERSAAPPHRASVLVTRPGAGGRQLAELLEARGLEVHLIPALAIVPPDDPSPLDAAAVRAAAGAYDWVVVTSANGVRALSEALARLEVENGGRGRALAPGVKVAAVGSTTAQAALRAGWSVDLAPEDFTGEALVDAFGGVRVEGARVLLPVAQAARPVVPEGLRARGAAVDVVVAYRSMPTSGPDAEWLRGLLEARRVDLVTLASPSAAEGVLEVAGAGSLRIPAVAIGPVTADAARALGFRVVAVAEPHTNEGLAAAAAEWLSRSRPAP